MSLSSVFSRELFWIDSVSQVETVLKELQCQTQFSLSCHGDNLGREGTLDILAIGTSDRRVFVFDVMKMGSSIFKTSLVNLLTSSDQVKLMFDCRMAADALLHLQGVQLEGILDVQLVDVVQRRKKASKRFWFLHKFWEVVNRRLDDNKCIEVIQKVNGKTYLAEKKNEPFWNKRHKSSILSQELLDYCAICTLKLFEVHECFTKDDTWDRNETLVASKRYADFIRSYDILPEKKFYHNRLVPDNVMVFYPKEEKKDYGRVLEREDC